MMNICIEGESHLEKSVGVDQFTNRT